MDKKVTAYILRYLLDHQFQSKADMARKLDVEYRSLLRVLAGMDAAKAGTIVLDKALGYCALYAISIDIMLKEFIVEFGGLDMIVGFSDHIVACRRLIADEPEPLTPHGKAVYKSLACFLQCVSACVCPCCKDWCGPWDERFAVNTRECYVGFVARSIYDNVDELYHEHAL